MLEKAISSNQPLQIGPSVLAADFLNLGAQLRLIADGGADYVHFDVMDGHFVPNISIGLPVLEAIRRGTSLPIDVHLMITSPEHWIERFADAGASSLTVHVEATSHIHRVVQAIDDAGLRSGVAINPGTAVESIVDVLPFVHTVLVMTVNPGFGGQTYLSSMTAKVERLRHLREKHDLQFAIQVDGGITSRNAGEVVAAGASSLVAGTSVFADRTSLGENIGLIRAAALGV